MEHSSSPTYHRYHIETADAPDIAAWPPRFVVTVKRAGLAKLLLTEMIKYKGDPEVVLSRPCMYGVFSGPVGGFAPRSEHCVGCLRCTTQYPEWVTVTPNPARAALGDSYFTAGYVNAVAMEAATGRVPVRGAGYRGKFGGEGWDGMWTDMSEIVRPTRDGIHGREFISTSVDIGYKPNFLVFDGNGEPQGAAIPNVFSLPLPTLFDAPPAAIASPAVARTFAEAAERLDTLVFLPPRTIVDLNLRGGHIVPLINPTDLELVRILPHPRLIMLDGWPPSVDDTLLNEIRQHHPAALIGLRTRFPTEERMHEYLDSGLRIFHFTANYHGRGAEGGFIFDQIRAAHKQIVARGIREEVTLLGSGGIIAAEHVPKAIIAGLDAVALDTPLLVALQARFDGDFTNRRMDNVRLPKTFDQRWGVQRLMNLMASWRDQLLEILGAMGMREVRRLRGEIGRALFQKHLEHEAFEGIEGYPG
jgi:hypothetical protein